MFYTQRVEFDYQVRLAVLAQEIFCFVGMACRNLGLVRWLGNETDRGCRCRRSSCSLAGYRGEEKRPHRASLSILDSLPLRPFSFGVAWRGMAAVFTMYNSAISATSHFLSNGSLTQLRIPSSPALSCICSAQFCLLQILFCPISRWQDEDGTL